MDKTKVLIAVIIALLVLNSATLVFLWMQRPPRPASGNLQARDPGQVLSQQLGFSREQQLRFDTLRTAHHGQMVVYGDSLKRLKDSLFTLLLRRDSVNAASLFAAIGSVHQKVEQVTFDHFQQVRSLCTPEQRQKYDRMLYNALTDVPRPSRETAREGQGQPGSPAHQGPDQSVIPPGLESGRPEPGQERQPSRQGNGLRDAPPDSAGRQRMRPGPGRRPPGPPPDGPKPGGPPPAGQQPQGPPPEGGR
jgi:periplasmic protein CpxP/Spy